MTAVLICVCITPGNASERANRNGNAPVMTGAETLLERMVAGRPVMWLPVCFPQGA